MTTIYVVQHGDKERLPGDPGLTEPGQRQAAVTAHWLQKMGLQALYSSPLRRARETAESLSRATGLAVQVDSRLRERLNWDGTQAFDAFLADWDRSTKDRDLILSNGESSRSAGERLRTFLAGLAGGSGPVAVVSHGGVTVDLLRNLLGDDRLPSHLVEDHIPPCAITTLDDLHVLGIAATSHLADWLLPATEIRRAPSGPNPRRQAQPCRLGQGKPRPTGHRHDRAGDHRPDRPSRNLLAPSRRTRTRNRYPSYGRQTHARLGGHRGLNPGRAFRDGR